MNTKTNTPATKKHLEDVLGGLFLMIIFTATWTIIAESSLLRYDHGIIAGIFGLIIIYMIICYFKANKMVRTFPEDTTTQLSAVEKRKDKRFYIIFAIEGIAIFCTQVILSNTGHDNLFFPFSD